MALPDGLDQGSALERGFFETEMPQAPDVRVPFWFPVRVLVR
jgi:hypothetical protein